MNMQPTKNSFSYDVERRTAICKIGGERMEIRGSHSKARKLFDSLVGRVDDRGLLYSPATDSRR